MKICQLCDNEVERTTKHHLIPRTLHRNKWFKKRFSKEQLHETIDLCPTCHREIHKLIPEKEMGRYFNTLELLKAHQNVNKYLQWLNR